MSDQKSAALNLLADFPPVPDEAWRAAVEADLKGADFDKKLVWQTWEGLRVQPYYRSGDLEGLDYLESLPGEAPFHRGHRSTGNTWSIVQEITVPALAEANSAAKEAWRVARTRFVLSASLRKWESTA